MKKQELLDKVYEDFIEETKWLKVKVDTPVAQVVGEYTRALKRVINRLGGTAYIIDGEKHTHPKEETDE